MLIEALKPIFYVVEVVVRYRCREKCGSRRVVDAAVPKLVGSMRIGIAKKNKFAMNHARMPTRRISL